MQKGQCSLPNRTTLRNTRRTEHGGEPKTAPEHLKQNPGRIKLMENAAHLRCAIHGRGDFRSDVVTRERSQVSHLAACLHIALAHGRQCSHFMSLKNQVQLRPGERESELPRGWGRLGSSEHGRNCTRIGIVTGLSPYMQPVFFKELAPNTTEASFICPPYCPGFASAWGHFWHDAVACPR